MTMTTEDTTHEAGTDECFLCYWAQMARLPHALEYESGYRLDWNGRFDAVCSCGRDVEWSAELLVPLCSCVIGKADHGTA